MTLLPIIERELRVRARRQATYWVRVAVGGLGALLCLMQFSYGTAFGGTASVSHYTFQGLATAAFLLCCGAFVLTADAISSERREGTLGLLILTRVRAFDVLLGKLGAAGITGLCAIIVFMPVLMIPVLSGGVMGGEAFRMGLVLLDTLFVGLAVGLLASAGSETWVSSFRKAVLLMICILILPAPFGFLSSRLHPWSQIVAAFSPLTGIWATGDAKFRTAPGQFWLALILLHFLGWFLLWRARMVMRRTLSVSPPGWAASTTKPERQEASPVTQRRPRLMSPQADPVGWVVRRQRGLRLAVWIGVAVGISYWLLIPITVRLLTSGAGLQALVWPISLVTQAAKAALFAWVASRFFLEGRRTGELELLVTTPHGAAAIVTAQWEMLKRLFLWPIIVLLLPMVLQAVSILAFRYGGLPGGWKVHYTISVILSGINTWLCVVTLCWVGMWFGLRSRNQSSAIIWTVGSVGLLPHLLVWLLSLVVFQVSRLFPNVGQAPAFLSSWLPSVFVLIFYLWLICRAKNLLSGDLRHAEARLFPTPRGIADWWPCTLGVIRRARQWTPS